MLHQRDLQKKRQIDWRSVKRELPEFTSTEGVRN